MVNLRVNQRSTFCLTFKLGTSYRVRSRCILFTTVDYSWIIKCKWFQPWSLSRRIDGLVLEKSIRFSWEVKSTSVTYNLGGKISLQTIRSPEVLDTLRVSVISRVLQLLSVLSSTTHNPKKSLILVILYMSVSSPLIIPLTEYTVTFRFAGC